MKLSVFLFLISFGYCFSQQSIKVTYECRTKIKSRNSQSEFPTIYKTMYQLTNNGVISEFKSIETKDKSEITKNDNKQSDTIFITAYKADKNLNLKDFNLEANFVKSELDGKFYFYTDTFQNRKLNFKSDIKKIDNYTCKLVEGVNSINNDPIKYWYTEAIPVIDGPMSYWLDLPGLILNIEYPLMEFYAVKIEFFDEKLQILNFPESTQFISRNQYESLLRESLALDNKPIKYNQEKIDSFFNKE